jgi:hypothetical protein
MWKEAVIGSYKIPAFTRRICEKLRKHSRLLVSSSICILWPPKWEKWAIEPQPLHAVRINSNGFVDYPVAPSRFLKSASVRVGSTTGSWSDDRGRVPSVWRHASPDVAVHICSTDCRPSGGHHPPIWTSQNWISSSVILMCKHVQFMFVYQNMPCFTVIQNRSY